MGHRVILQRLSRALRRHDWSVVAIEILVVVVGIFLGLQVDDWNEARKFRQQEAVYLDKIRGDLVMMRATLAKRATHSETAARRMTSALQKLEACEFSDAAEADLGFALVVYQVSQPIDYLDATYGEMVASGAHARIQSQELKQSISQAFSALREYGDNLRSFRISVPVVDAIVWNHVTFGIDEDTAAQSVSFDMAEICTSRPMRNALVEMIDIQQDSLGTSRRTMQLVDHALALLGEHTARQ
jgi:hypothetical protein